jgi:hypothetical protein
MANNEAGYEEEGNAAQSKEGHCCLPTSGPTSIAEPANT